MKTKINGIEFLEVYNKLRVINFQPKNIFRTNEIIRLYASEDKLNFSLFNGVMGAIASLDAITERQGDCSLYMTPKINLPISVDKNHPEMDLIREENESHICCNTSQGDMKLKNSNDSFIPMPEFDLGSKEYLFQINGAELKNSFKSVEKAIKLNFINDDSSNVVLLGNEENNSIKFAGSDGYRINICKTFVPLLKKDFKTSLSAECFNKLVSIFGKKSDIIDVYTISDIKNKIYYCFENKHITIFILFDEKINILNFENLYYDEFINLSNHHVDRILFDTSSLKETLCKIKKIGSVDNSIILKISTEANIFKIELYTKKEKEVASQYVAYKLPILNQEELNFDFPTMLVVAPFFVSAISLILKTKSKVAQISLFNKHNLISISEENKDEYISIISYTDHLDFFDIK